MSRLVIPTNSEAQNVVEGLYKDLERRIIASPPGLCPVDLTAAFLKMCHAQTCGKCVPCRIGLAQLSNLLEDILNGKGTMKHLTMLEETARVIESTADCAIGYTAAQMVLKGLDGFKEDFMEHILHNRCRSNLDQPVPCVALCGSIGKGAEELYNQGITAIFSAVKGITTFEEIMRTSGEDMAFLTDSVLRLLTIRK